jgi:uncharacterized protein
MADRVYNPEPVLDAFIRKDYGQVFRSVAPFAEAGDSEAQCMLSLLYQCGYGVEKDAVTAERWLIRAAEQGSALAWNNLGTLYLLDLPGVPRDPKKAEECCRRAKHLGFDLAHT